MKAALLLAGEMGHSDVINLLVSEGADIFCKSSMQTSLLHLSASLGKVDAVKSLLERGMSYDMKDSRRRTPLHE